jgi:hypothetical protein
MPLGNLHRRSTALKLHAGHRILVGAGLPNTPKIHVSHVRRQKTPRMNRSW